MPLVKRYGKMTRTVTINGYRYRTITVGDSNSVHNNAKAEKKTSSTQDKANGMPHTKTQQKAPYFPPKKYICSFSENMPFSFSQIQKCPSKNILGAESVRKTFRQEGFTFAVEICILVEGLQAKVKWFPLSQQSNYSVER